jgi:hypothetical protein
MSRLTNRGANANQAARLPALQAARPDAGIEALAKCVEGLREWVEVRLGSRGDRFERAVTMREFEQRLKPITDFVDMLGSFDGGIESLKSTESAGLPAQVRNGAFVAVRTDTEQRLYFGLNGVWREVTLVPP